MNLAKTEYSRRGGNDLASANLVQCKLPLIKPSKDAVRRIRHRLRTETRALLGGNAAAVMRKLTPVIRGWAAYYRTRVSSEVFSALDNWADRRGKQHNGPLSVLLLAQLKAQRGRCPHCGTLLLAADREPQSPQEWEL